VDKTKMTISNLTDTAPKASSGNFKRTKIVATIGPATNTYEAIYDLIKAGANAIRLNFSHGSLEERAEQIKWIRKASQELSKPVAIIQDLQGPKVRLGDFEGVVPIQKGQNLRFRYNADYHREGVLPTQYDLSQKVKRGERLYLYDGKLLTTITSVNEKTVHAVAENEGIVYGRKGINLPDTDFEGDILTKKDKKDINFGVEHGVDWVALSFVQTAKDIKSLRHILTNLGSKAKIIAKIETKSAAENLEEIIEEADASMVARGDLAIENGLESVPILQREIVILGLKYGRPTIIATQMLASMTEHPTPTRAEVSDVATGAIIGADAMMLSDETAVGKYPVEAVKTMKKIILRVQKNPNLRNIRIIESPVDKNPQNAICSVIVKLAKEVDATAIVAETKSGATALKIAAKRPKQPIIVVTSSQVVAQQLAILYGCVVFIRKDEPGQSSKLTDWLKLHRVLKKGDVIVSAMGKHPGVVGTTDTIKVRAL
jgi:pyruvate kinase